MTTTPALTLHALRRQLCVAILLALSLLMAGTATAADHTVTVGTTGFDPDMMTITAGDTVTWVNDGTGQHNVVADDASFTSGTPSTDTWQYSHLFNQGGTYTYHCEVHVNETGTIDVEGVFASGLELGNTDEWSDAVPLLPNCDCYFSSDCVSPNGFCDWGVLTMEDGCLWRLNKPNGTVGAGCDEVYNGTWIAGICDGICSPSRAGSSLGWEERDVLVQGIQLWAAAILEPAEAGGEPIDPDRAKRIEALPFRGSHSAINLGRQVADVFIQAGIPELYDHFCHFEAHPGDHAPALAVDLSDDPCRAQVAHRAIDALIAEILEPGRAATTFATLPEVCGGRSDLFEPRCAAGPGAMACVAKRIAATAEFLTIPNGSVLPIRFETGGH